MRQETDGKFAIRDKAQEYKVLEYLYEKDSIEAYLLHEPSTPRFAYRDVSAGRSSEIISSVICTTYLLIYSLVHIQRQDHRAMASQQDLQELLRLLTTGRNKLAMLAAMGRVKALQDANLRRQVLLSPKS